LRVLIHCNGGPEIGVGHVVRSLALSEEAVSSGHDVTVAGELEGSFVRGLLADAGVAVRELGRYDAEALGRLVDELDPAVVHLDTYDLGTLPSSRRSPLWSNMADGGFGHRAADVEIDPNHGAELEPPAGDQPVATSMRGSRYAPLRTSVTRRRGQWQGTDRVDSPLRLLVVMGGADPNRLTPGVLDLLAGLERPLQVTAIAPREAHEPLRERMRSYRHLVVDVAEPVSDLPALAVRQDVVVSAAGTSVWELCCIGVPMALVCAADNQRAGYERVLAAGVAVGLGTMRAEPDEAALDGLRELLDSPAARQRLAGRASQVVDGLGAWRVVRAWEQLVDTADAGAAQGQAHLVAREATMADSALLLRWRNDLVTRSSSRISDEVDPARHESWLRSSIDRSDRLLLLASAEGEGDIGTVRWDRVDDGAWEVSITVAPEHRGRSLAGALLRAGEKTLRETHDDVRALLATVHERNPASRRLFARAGYLPYRPADDDGFLALRKTVDQR
jgi:spore coat polysaccharide biosynthesis predicted glycosyltransferase SpsG/RimJ/RimL family protein N-acetyltransferase